MAKSINMNPVYLRSRAKKLGITIPQKRGRPRLNTSESTVHTKPHTSPSTVGEEMIREYSVDTAYVFVRRLDIHTLEQALDYAKVDLSVWEVDRYLINDWNTTMGAKTSGSGCAESFTNVQVKVWLKRIVPDDKLEALKALIERIPSIVTPRYPSKILRTDGEYAWEISPYDIHFGKYAWGDETLQGDYDIDIATVRYLASIGKQLDYMKGFQPDRIFYVMGQDLMHVENTEALTPAGHHHLDTDTRLQKVYLAAKEATIQGIRMLMDVAPVEVLWVPGNHDKHASMFVADVLKEHFRSTDRVTVDTTPASRKARLWGNLLVGFAHDASGRYANATVNMLAQFWPDMWGKSKYRELHTGHKHKKQETKFMPVKTAGGVIIRQLPTLSNIDAWHYEEGFVDAVPGAESFVWSRNNGVVGHFTAYVD